MSLDLERRPDPSLPSDPFPAERSAGVRTPLSVEGRRMLVERLLAGWTVAEVAEAAGVSRSTVRRWRDRHEAEGDGGLRDRSAARTRSAEVVAMRPPAATRPRSSSSRPAPSPQPSAVEQPRPSPRRTARWTRWTMTFLVWTMVGTASGIALSVVVPSLFRHQVFTVMSGSMYPAIRTGDVVVDAKVSPAEVRIGDIVTFRDPEDSVRLITHRVRSIRVKGDQVLFITKGDASNAVQHWGVAASGTLGRVDYRIPRLGYLLAWDRGRLGRLVFLAIPAVLLGAWKIFDIWKPEPREVGDEPLPVA